MHDKSAGPTLCGGCFAVVGIGANKASKEIDEAIESIDATENSDEQPADAKPVEKEDEPEPGPEPAKWVTVGKLSGDTNKAGPDFKMNGCEARLTYDVKGGDAVLVAIYVMESGTKLMEDGGIPVAAPDKPGKGETSLRLDEGDYYIEVASANASWNVQVQEKC